MTDNPASKSNRAVIVRPPDQKVERKQQRTPTYQYDGVLPAAFRRIRNDVIRREIESLAARERAWNEVIAVFRDRNRMIVEYEASLVRVENLPELRMAEEAKVLLEIQQIFEAEEDRQLERNLWRTTKEAELIKAQRALDELKKPPPKPKPEQPKESRGKRRVAIIKGIREERDEMIAAILDGRAEEEVDEDDRALIDEIHLAADHQIKSFLEEDRD